MFITGKNLLQAPFLTADMVCFQIVDAVVDSAGQFIEKLIIKKLNHNYRFDEYHIPVSDVVVNFVDDRAYIGKSLEQIEKYKRVQEEPDFTHEWPCDVYLLSHLSRFSVEGRDENLGQIHDVILDPITLAIRYYTVRISHSIFRKWAFIPVYWMERLDWILKVTFLTVSRDEVVSEVLYPAQTFMTETVEKDLLSRIVHIHPRKAKQNFSDDIWQWISHDI